MSSCESCAASREMVGSCEVRASNAVCVPRKRRQGGVVAADQSLKALEHRNVAGQDKVKKLVR